VLVALPGAFGVTAARILDTTTSTRQAREHAAGYATLVQGPGPVDVEHVDPRTGHLVSFAGEDLTDAERQARIAAINADTRSGVGQRGRTLLAAGVDPALGVDPAGGKGRAAGTRHTDEDLFAGQPRKFITLPWTVRQGFVWGWFFVGLAPVGFLVVAMLDAGGSTPAIAPRVILGVVLATAAVGVVLLSVMMCRTDTMLGDGGPGGSSRSRGALMSLWIVPLGTAVLLAGGSVYGVAGLDRAALAAAAWAIPWLVAWAVMVRRAEAGSQRSRTAAVESCCGEASTWDG
jgi:hypothetical protein